MSETAPVMRRGVRTHIAQAARLPTVQPAYAAGIRAAIATVGPMVLLSATGHPSAGLWMGLAGFNTSLGDKGGARRVRFYAMLAALAFGSVSATIGAIAGRHIWSAVPVIALWALIAGLARAWGQAATNTGTLSLATYAVSIAMPEPTLAGALMRGAFVIAGSLFSMALALLIWRTRPYRPARLAVAAAYRAVAAYTLDGMPEQAEKARTGIDHARVTLAAVRRGLQGELPRGERLLVLVENCDRMLDLLAQPEQPQRQSIRPALEQIATAIEREHNDPLAGLDPASDGDPLPDLVMSAVTTTRELNDDRGPALVRFSKSDFHRRFVEPLLGNLTWQSTVLRHAFRVAVAVAAAVTLTSLFHMSRGYWVTFSVIVVLQPYTSATFQKGLQRVGGTIAGGLIAAALIALVHWPPLMLTIIFFGAAATVALMPLNYALYSLFLTPTFVLLAEANASDWHLVWLRIGNTLAGACIAWLAAWLLWPASERGLVRDELATALRELADYTRCVGECADQHAAESRRAFLVALQNAETSLQRLLGDGRTPDIEMLMAMQVYARRFAVALSVLANLPISTRIRLGSSMRQIGGVLIDLADALAEARSPAPLPDMPATKNEAKRLLDPLTGLHRAVARLTSHVPERETAATT